MSTEYRRGIPSTAHVEAATRLGLLWHRRGRDAEHRTRFVVENGQVLSDYGEEGDPLLALGPVTNNERHHAYYCIRPDGTPVDWEVLDQEVARVGQPATVTPIASATQPQGFRADLWARICSIVYQELKPLYDIVNGAQGEAAMPEDVESEWSVCSGGSNTASGNWRLCRNGDGLYAQGAYVRWHPGEDDYGTPLRNFAAVLDAVAERRVAERMRGQTPANPDAVLTVTSTQPEPRRFADVRPDRHGWRWWRIVGAPDAGIIGARFEAMREQWSWLAMADGAAPTGNLIGSHSWTHSGVWASRTVIPTDEQGNPVSWEAAGFAAEAVRLAQENVQRAANDATPARSVGDIEWTVTGQPVTRDMTVEPATGMVRSTHTTRIRQLDRLVTEAIQAGNTGNFSIESPTPPRPDQFSNDFIASAPITAESFARVLQQMDGIRGPVMVAATRFAETPQTRALVEAQRAREEAETRARALQQVRGGVERELSGQQISQTLIDDNVDYAPLPRFTADELDDVDHSKTTKLDEVTLRRGKLPTVEQIAKYREVRARRTGGSAADALKESRIDCEVAQYVLERWAGGLGDELALWLLRAVGKYSRSDLRFTQRSVDELAQRELTHEAGAIETAESSPAVQRERQEAEERRQRLAQLRQRLAAERTAQPQEMAKESEVSRFDLIEPDPQADPTASIRAWEARQAAAKVCPMAAPPRIAKPAAAPRRPAIEVVDAEVDGLSRSEAFAALFGRALNGGC